MTCCQFKTRIYLTVEKSSPQYKISSVCGARARASQIQTLESDSCAVGGAQGVQNDAHGQTPKKKQNPAKLKVLRRSALLIGSLHSLPVPEAGVERLAFDQGNRAHSETSGPTSGPVAENLESVALIREPIEDALNRRGGICRDLRRLRLRRITRPWNRCPASWRFWWKRGNSSADRRKHERTDSGFTGRLT